MILPAEIEAVISALRSEVSALRAEVGELRSENAALRAENAELRSQNAELRRRLDQDSSTSSKPPSSDGFRKKPRMAGSLRGVSDKSSGGQPGHKGDTLRRTAAPDRIVEHSAWTCRHCRGPLTAAMRTGEEARQVFDLPERLIEVTEHRAGIYACAHCRGRTRAAFPDGVTATVQYGPRFRAAAVYLNLQQLIPEDRVARTMADLFGAARFCPRSLTQWMEAQARAFEPVRARIAALARQARVRCLDETGFRVAGRNHWLHTVATDALTLYRVSQKRSDLPGDLIDGVIVHDGLKGYYGLLGSGLRVLGTFSLYAYEAVAGVQIDPSVSTTEDIDLLFDARGGVSIAASEEFESESLIRILRRIDKSFERSGQAFRAVNRDGFLVDLIKPLRNPPWSKEADRIGSDPEDLAAVEIEGLAWHESAPPFEASAIDERGEPLRIVTTDPRVFAAHKFWLSQHSDREPFKRRRDREQAEVVASLVALHLAHLPFEEGALQMLPRDLVDQVRPLFTRPDQGDL